MEIALSFGAIAVRTTHTHSPFTKYLRAHSFAFAFIRQPQEFAAIAVTTTRSNFDAADLHCEWFTIHCGPSRRAHIPDTKLKLSPKRILWIPFSICCNICNRHATGYCGCLMVDGRCSVCAVRGAPWIAVKWNWINLLLKRISILRREQMRNFWMARIIIIGFYCYYYFPTNEVRTVIVTLLSHRVRSPIRIFCFLLFCDVVRCIETFLFVFVVVFFSTIFCF